MKLAGSNIEERGRVKVKKNYKCYGGEFRPYFEGKKGHNSFKYVPDIVKFALQKNRSNSHEEMEWIQ